MELDLRKEQFEFQDFKGGYLIVTYKEKNRFKHHPFFMVVIKPGNAYYELANDCRVPNPKWYALNQLSLLVKKCNGLTIPLI